MIFFLTAGEYMILFLTAGEYIILNTLPHCG